MGGAAARPPTGLLTATMALAPAPVYALTALSPVVLTLAGVTEREIGLMIATAFAVSALASVPAGRAVDRFGARPLIIAIATCTTVALAALAIWPSTVALVFAVVVSGLAQGIANPATNKVIATAGDVAARPRAVGAKQSGVPLSQLTIGATTPLLGEVVGLSGALAVLLVVSALIAGWAATVPMESGPTRTLSMPTPMSQGMPFLLTLAFFSGAAAQATNAYLPMFGHRELGMSAAAAGSVVAVVGGLGIIGRLLWTRVYGNAAAGRFVLPAVTSAGTSSAFVLLLATTQGGAGLYWLGLSVHALSTLAVTGVLFLTAMDAVPLAGVGRVTGYIGICQFAGFAAGPAAMGLLVSSPGGYVAGWTFVAACSGLSLVLALVSRPALKIRRFR